MDNRIVIRHPRKREFFSKLALQGQTAQSVLSEEINKYLKKEDIMKNITIKNVEVQDLVREGLAYQDPEDETFPVSSVQVSVTVEIELPEYNVTFDLCFQTSTTYDYGAINTALDLDMTCDANSDFYDFCSAHEIDFEKIVKSIKEKSHAQKLWDEYIEQNYEPSDEYFGGMDANSEVNKMRKK